MRARALGAGQRGAEGSHGLDVVTRYRCVAARRGFVTDAAQWRALERVFAELKDTAEERQSLDVEGRRIAYRKRAGGLVWFDFTVLCGGPRSYTDYVDLAMRFHTVMLSGVPRLGPQQADAARRFTWLIDVLYDERVKLVCSAASAPGEIFTAGGDAHRAAAEFARTVSRLTEMQSTHYLQSERPLR